MRPLTATELQQMTGRAGRRGMDRIGFAVVVPGKFMDIPQQTARGLNSPAGAVDSQSPHQFLHGAEPSHVPQPGSDPGKSWHTPWPPFNSPPGAGDRPGKIFPAPKFLSMDFQRHLSFLQAHGYVTPDGSLTTDGLWASKLRVDQPLMIAEGFRLDVLPDSDPGPVGRSHRRLCQ